MKILFYSKEQKDGKGSTHEAMMEVALPDNVECFSTISSLVSRLRQPRFGKWSEILVLSASNRRELLHFKAMKDAFNDIPLILILPDRDGKTVSIGQSMFPRFLWFRDNHIKELKTVLFKIAFRQTHGRDHGLCAADGHYGETDERA